MPAFIDSIDYFSSFAILLFVTVCQVLLTAPPSKRGHRAKN